ncbi:hypothetical protein FE789_28390 [Burkholderia pseudomallei]|nr:hypothetical protein FE789_28390 [Burkholderia pseudomallei]
MKAAFHPSSTSHRSWIQSAIAAPAARTPACARIRRTRRPVCPRRLSPPRGSAQAGRATRPRRDARGKPHRTSHASHTLHAPCMPQFAPQFAPRRVVARVAAAALFSACAAPGVSGAAEPAAATRGYDIPAGPLDAALTRFGREAGILLSFPGELTTGLRSPGLHGRADPAAALDRLLTGTGLVALRQPSGGYTLARLPGPAAAALMPRSRPTRRCPPSPCARAARTRTATGRRARRRGCAATRRSPRCRKRSPSSRSRCCATSARAISTTRSRT